MEKIEILKRKGQFFRLFDQENIKRNTKHIKLRAARRQKRLYEQLTLEEKGFLFSLLPYLEWETNILVGDGTVEEKNKPLNFARIDEIIGVSAKFRRKIIQSLVDKKVLGFITVRNKRAAIVVNPDYALRGVKPDDALKQVFDFEMDLDEEDEE
nr:hypothetical protein [Paenibacillus elgii]